ncbi:hypothetical protein [Burkholderia gladioli]|jgi:hypothetical protein|nr:hypothetical protein [Burkholderia gladioli]
MKKIANVIQPRVDSPISFKGHRFTPDVIGTAPCSTSWCDADGTQLPPSA